MNSIELHVNHSSTSRESRVVFVIVFTCYELVAMFVPERMNIVREKNLCLNCLCKTHCIYECQASSCTQWHKRHHSLPHLNTVNLSQQAQTYLICHSSHISSNVILSTFIINITDRNGDAQPCIDLQDSCSETHLPTEKM